MRKRISEKLCICWTCDKDFHSLGIARHRKAHQARGEDCKITFTHGNTVTYNFAKSKQKEAAHANAERICAG